MNPVPAALMVAVLTIVGRWSRGKDFDTDTATKNAIGVGGVAIGLAFISEVNEELGKAFGALVVVGVAMYHLKPISNAVTKGLS